MNEYLPPKRELDETTPEYLERLEWHRQRVPDDILNAPIQGYTASPNGFRHWTESEYIGAAGSGIEGHRENASVFTETTVSMPSWQPVVWRKRTPAERVEDILGRLTTLAVQSYTDNVMRLPRSICEKLVRLGVYPSVEDAMGASVEDVTRAFDVYARALLEAAPSNDLAAQITTSAPISGVDRPSSVTTATAQEGATQAA